MGAETTDLNSQLSQLGAVHILRNLGWGGGLPDLLQYYMGGGQLHLLQYYMGVCQNHYSNRVGSSETSKLYYVIYEQPLMVNSAVGSQKLFTSESANTYPTASGSPNEIRTDHMIFVAVFRMIYTSPEYDSGLTFGSAIVQCKTQTQIIQLTTTSSYARFLSSVSIKKCLDATKAWSWIIARMSTNTNTKVH